MITPKEKIQMYEAFLHKLQLNAEVCLNAENVKKLISNACAWSYAHRKGNGELSDDEQQVLIDNAFYKLCDTTKDN